MQYFKTAVLRRRADYNGLSVVRMSINASIIKAKEPIIRMPTG